MISPTRPHAVMFSLDTALITRPNDDSRVRHMRFAECFGQLTIIVLTGADAPAAPVAASPHLTLIATRSRHPLGYPFDAVRIGARVLAEAARAGCPAVLLIAQDLWRTGAAAAWLRARFGIPVLAQNHSVLFTPIPHTAASFVKRMREHLLKAWARFTLRHTDLYRTVCEAEKTAAVQLGFPAERVVVLPLGTAAPFPEAERAAMRARVRERLGLAADDRVILWAGNSQPFKRVHLLIDALAVLAPAVPRARLVLVGDLDRAPVDVRARAQAAGVLDRVRFAAHVPHAEMPAYYAAADVYAQPSAYEGGPRTFFEAGAAGLPLVGFAVPALDERVVPGENGLLALPGDVPMLAAHLAALLNSPALCAQMGERSRAIALERYSAERYPAAWVGVWQHAARVGLRGGRR